MCVAHLICTEIAPLSVGAEGRPAHACAHISILSYGAFSDVM